MEGKTRGENCEEERVGVHFFKRGDVERVGRY